MQGSMWQPLWQWSGVSGGTCFWGRQLPAARLCMCPWALLVLQVELEDVQLQTGVSSTNAVTIASAVMAAGSLGSAQPCSFSDPSAPLRLPCSAPTVSGSHAGASSVDDATHSKRSSAASAKVHGHRVSPTASPAAVRRDRTLQDGRGRPLLASDYAAAAASAPCCDAGTLADARGSSGTHSVTNQLYNSELVPAYVPASRRVSATSYLTEEINSEASATLLKASQQRQRQQCKLCGTSQPESTSVLLLFALNTHICQVTPHRALCTPCLIHVNHSLLLPPLCMRTGLQCIRQ